MKTFINRVVVKRLHVYMDYLYFFTGHFVYAHAHTFLPCIHRLSMALMTVFMYVCGPLNSL